MQFHSLIAPALCAGLVSFGASAQELTTNGDLETGDLTGWADFTSGSQVFEITSDAANGSSAIRLFNADAPSAATIKQANLAGASIGDEVVISFNAKGTGAVGGVVFAEFFHELSGGGTSGGAGILSGGPLSLTSSYQAFSFNHTIDSDVSGGVTLQFNAAAGAATGSQMELFLDDVSVVVVPEPASAALLGLGTLAMLRRRRK